MKSTRTLHYNVQVHNKIAKNYEKIHGEIYNAVEQARVRETLKTAMKEVQTKAEKLHVLDFGCGAGNLTSHLTSLGAEVTAADVSQGFLDLVASRTYQENVKSFLLNGNNLQGLPDATFDMVVMYSVLHHVPEYLSLIKEFARVLKPGGVLLIDHEASEKIWEHSEAYQEFARVIKKTSKRDYKKYLYIANYIDKLLRMTVDPKYQREGDIHVWKDDHIMWSSIREKLQEAHMEIAQEEEYLLYRRGYDQAVYDSYKERIHDMHFCIARKVK